jgi:hypothetical protein
MTCAMFCYMIVEVIRNFKVILGRAIVFKIFQRLAHPADSYITLNRFGDFFHFFKAGSEQFTEN